MKKKRIKQNKKKKKGESSERARERERWRRRRKEYKIASQDCGPVLNGPWYTIAPAPIGIAMP
jgi:hypothetical protein